MADLLPRLPRVEALLGRRLAQLDAADLDRIVTNRFREDTDLEFKGQMYSDNDKGNADSASDVAAMANGPGGVIFIGIDEDNGAANAVTPTPFSETTELRIRQAIISRTAPAPQFVIHPLAVSTGNGVYLLIVPASPYAPHAVRTGAKQLGYPRRAGPHIRWLAESEVAEAYRSRFLIGEQRAERVGLVRNEGQGMLGPGVWLTITLVPLVPGSFVVRHRSMRDLTTEVQGRYQGGGYARHVFTGAPQGEAGVGRVVMYTGREHARTSAYGHGEFHSDGSAFIGTPAGFLRRTPLGEPSTIWSVDDERLVEAAIGSVDLAVQFATEQAGVVGDAFVSASLLAVGEPSDLELVHIRQFGMPTAFSGAHIVRGFQHSTVLVNMDDASAAVGRLIIARMALTGIFQWFGYPEVPQITEEGKLRNRYIATQNKQGVQRWANDKGIEFVETTLDLEP